MPVKYLYLDRLWRFTSQHIGSRRMLLFGKKADLTFARAVGFVDDAISHNVRRDTRRAVGAYLASASGSGGYRLANAACASVATDALPLMCLAVILGFICGYLACLVDAVAVKMAIRLIKRIWCMLVRNFFESNLVRRRVNVEVEKFRLKVERDFNKTSGLSFPKLPARGLEQSMIESQLLSWAREEENHWVGGKISGCVYHEKDKADAVGTTAYSLFSLTNPLHPTVFPAVRKMESEIIEMTASLFHCPKVRGESSAGIVTSGGTESILLAVLSYRSWGRAKGIQNPNIVAPLTIHAAFDKACAYFCVELRKVPVEASTMQASVSTIRRQMDSNTIAVAISAVSFPHGALDDVEGIAAVAKRAGVGCHVDCCLGSFLIPFARDAGFPLGGQFDFEVPGVTSISCDPHKYGNCPKGISVLMFREARLRRHMFESNRVPDWMGGVYATGTMAGSRPGGIVAGAWGVLVATGRQGYIDAAKKILTATKRLEQGIRNINGLYVVGAPALSVVAFSTTPEICCNILNLLDFLATRGWELNALQAPAALHVAVTSPMVAMVDALLSDIDEGMAKLRADVENGTATDGPSAVMYGATASVPTVIRDEVIDTYLEACLSNLGGEGSAENDTLAPCHERD